MPVDTTNISGRRKLHFDNVHQILEDAERIVAADHVALGNWSSGQILMHLARSIDQAVDGANFRVPWYIRLGAGLMKNRMLTQPMKPGFKLPAYAARDLVPGATSPEAGLKALREAIGRLDGTAERAANPVFGRLSLEQWEQLHCRHAELHMSFLVPKKQT